MNNFFADRFSTIFLKLTIGLITIGSLIALIWFPQTEGRATNLDLISIYKDPLIIYVYISSIPFYIALFQTFKLLSYIQQNKFFSSIAIRTLRNIKYSALTIIIFLIGAIFFIRFFTHGDDPAGPIMLGLISIFISLVVISITTIFQNLLQNAIEKPKNKS